MEHGNAQKISTLVSAAVGGLLFVELYLAGSGSSLCPTAACQVVGLYIRFGEQLLLTVGGCYFILLAGALFFAGRYSSQAGWVAAPLLLLFGGAAFDGALLGFQFFTIYQHCLLCIGVACALGLIFVLYSLGRRQWFFLLLGIVVWLGGMTANGILQVPVTVGAYDSMAFYRRPAVEGTEKSPRMTLLFSVDCPHCKKVFAYLAHENPEHVEWRFVSVDQQQRQLAKLTVFLQQAANTDNPFQLLLDSVRQAGKIQVAKRRVLAGKARAARAALAAMGLDAVPVLVVETAQRRILLHGDRGILQWLQDNEELWRGDRDRP